LPVGLVDELEDVRRPLKDHDEARSLLEQAALPYRLGLEPPLGHDLGGDVGAGAEEACDGPRFVPHGRIGEGEMRFLRIALPLHDEGDVVHVDRMPGIGLLDDGPEVVADLGPHVQERPAQGRRMFPREDLRVGIVVEKGGFGPPGDEHGLGGSEHHAHEGLETVRPGLGRAERRARPVVGAHERAGLSPAGEKTDAAVDSGRSHDRFVHDAPITAPTRLPR
jgi:hypothetical protein